MLEEMRVKELINLYDEVELPLTRVLFDMERTGFRVDLHAVKELGDLFSSRIKALEEQIYAEAGSTFNILSTKQLGTVLFDTLGLPTQKKNKSGYSTDAGTLEALEDKHPIVKLVMEYRFLSKLKSTFIDGLLNLTDQKTGRVHTSFNQNVAATGRISSTEPNLQNIPARTEVGREIRKAFVASEGNVLVGADYSQIELRLLAHMSGDEHMIDAFNDGEDIHVLPDSYNLVLNSNHPLILKVSADLKAKESSLLEQNSAERKRIREEIEFMEKEHKNKKPDEIPQVEKDDLEKSRKELTEIEDKRKNILEAFGNENKTVRQLIDLALLSNNMLKGEELSTFVRRSVELL
jgi:hypothetical protein